MMIPGDEEYHFKDLGGSDTIEEEEHEPAKTVLARPDQMVKHVLIVAGVLLGIFFIYSITQIMFSSSSEEDEIITDNQVVSKTDEKPFDGEETGIMTGEPIPNVGTEERIPQITGVESTEIKKALEFFTETIKKLESKIVSLDSRLVDLNYSHSNLKAELEHQNREISGIKARKKSLSSKYGKKFLKKQQFYVKAAIHGRAWLKDEKGSTLTVRRGDKLPGYGIVSSIDPDQGEVETTSGGVIRFNSNDR